MASLALMVCVIFLVTLISGPLSILLGYFGFFWISMFLSLVALVFGVMWATSTIFPICLIGFLSFGCGAYNFLQFLKNF